MFLSFMRKVEVTAGGLAALRVHHSDAEIHDILWNLGTPYIADQSTWAPFINKPKVVFVTVLLDANEYTVIRREWWVYYSYVAGLTIEVIS